MTKNLTKSEALLSADEAIGVPSDMLALVIGSIEQWRAKGLELPEIEGFRFVELSEVTDALLGEFPAQMVLSPLFSDGFDALDVARRLRDVGYAGQYRAIADDLPRPDLVIKEIKSAAPGVDFSVLNLPRRNK